MKQRENAFPNVKHTITIDFETFYSKGYTLSTMPTQEYVLSPHFETIGVAVAVDDEDPQWFTGAFHEIREWLKQFPWETSRACAHNAIFDASILEWRFGIRPAMWFCTMMAARPLCAPFTKQGRVNLKYVAEYLELGVKGTEVVNALGLRRADFPARQLAQYGEYCKNDTHLCRGIYYKLAPQLPASEQKLIDATIKKYTRPTLTLDVPVLRGRLGIVEYEKERALSEAGLDSRDLLMSNKLFAEALRMFGVEPPTKVSPTTGKLTYAFAKNDVEFKELLDHDDIHVQTLVAARLKHKSTQEETRLARFIKVGDVLDRLAGKLGFAIPLLYYGAHTGRFSGLDKLNLQNLPRKSALRRALKAPHGYTVVAGDLSQIEARILAVLAEQDDLVAAFDKGEDVYCLFASKLYGRTITKADEMERFIGKTAILGLGYGLGYRNFHSTLRAAGIDITLMEAHRIVDTYRHTYPRIPLLWSKMDGLIARMKAGWRGKFAPLQVMREALVLPNGMRLFYPDLKETADGWEYRYRNARVKLYGGKLCIAKGTEVLTDRGWVPIEDVRVEDRIFDGVELVNHGGLIYNGIKQTILLNDVRMTPDHEVLTTDGWQEASQVQGPDGADLRYVDRDETLSQYWQELGMGLSLRLREDNQEAGQGRDERVATRGDTELRVPDRRDAIAPKNPRDVETPSLCRVAIDARPVPATNPPIVVQLRGTGDRRMSQMGNVREVLGGHGANIQAGAYARPQEQRRQLHQAQLSVGRYEDSDWQQAGVTPDRHHQGTQTDGAQQVNAVLPMEPWAVYDITDCGPRQRFVVRGASGPFIVHNCENVVQALARIVVSTAELYLYDRGYLAALQVHDELVYSVPTSKAEAFSKVLHKVLCRPVPWMPNLPIDAEVGMGDNYAEAK